jgi:hypothetical protein
MSLSSGSRRLKGAAGLRYVLGARPSTRRKKAESGFTYMRADDQKECAEADQVACHPAGLGATSGYVPSQTATW